MGCSHAYICVCDTRPPIQDHCFICIIRHFAFCIFACSNSKSKIEIITRLINNQSKSSHPHDTWRRKLSHVTKNLPTRDTPRTSLTLTLCKQLTHHSVRQPHISLRFQHHCEANARCRTRSAIITQHHPPRSFSHSHTHYPWYVGSSAHISYNTSNSTLATRHNTL